MANIFAAEKQVTLSFVDKETKMLVSINRVNIGESVTLKKYSCKVKVVGVGDGRDGFAGPELSEKPKCRKPKKQQKLNIWKS